MTTYKELADRLETFAANCCIPDDENTPPREAAAILRSLDAQPVFWYRPTCGGEMYEGPVHNNSVGGKMLREEKPDEWRPLYAAPVAAVRKAMARLADLLDEDKFMEIEGIFTSAGFTPPVAAQASKPLSDAEILGCAHDKTTGLSPWGIGSIKTDYINAVRRTITAFCQKNGIKERG